MAMCVALTVLTAGPVAGAQVPTPVPATVPSVSPPKGDTLPHLRDSTALRPAKHDSTKPHTRADSIQAPFGRGSPPPGLDIGDPYTFTRDQIFASGALTLTDLLARLPGVTTFQSGWIATPQVAAYYGDMSRIRIFYDGVELDNLEPRNGAVPDLSTIPLWSLDHITLTRGANDLRIDLESWQYDNTTPYTRTDVLTGDLSTDLYRAFFAKRFYNGADLQIGAQQAGTTDNRNGGGGQILTLFGRYGVAHKLWSMDVTVLRTNANRSITSVRYGFPSDHPDPDPGSPGELLPNYEGGSTMANFRAAIGHPGTGPFLQFVASSFSLHESSPQLDSAALLSTPTYGFPPDTLDSTASESQYVLTTGTDVGGLRLRLIDRYRTQRGGWFNTATATADYTSRLLSWDAMAERDPYYGYTSLEAGGRFSPLPFLALSAYIGQRNADSARTSQPNSRSMRIEGGVRLFGGLWLSTGILSRDTAVLVPPIVFDSAFRPFPVGRTSGHIFALRGPITHGFSIDAAETYWPNPTPYIPKQQFHGELTYFTEWLSRFPKKNFSFKLSAIADYRSEVAFPEIDNTTGQYFYRYTGGLLNPPTQVPIYSFQVEIRILRGIITYQFHNSTLVPYDEVPGFAMPRGVSLYGVRWYFFD
jgi:hypothetical protein